MFHSDEDINVKNIKSEMTITYAKIRANPSKPIEETCS